MCLSEIHMCARACVPVEKQKNKSSWTISYVNYEQKFNVSEAVSVSIVM